MTEFWLEFEAPNDTVIQSDRMNKVTAWDEIQGFCKDGRGLGLWPSPFRGIKLFIDIEKWTTKELSMCCVGIDYTKDVWIKLVSKMRYRDVARNWWGVRYGYYVYNSLLECTVNAERIYNWAIAFTTFLDSIKDADYKHIREMFSGRTTSEKFVAMAYLWDDQKLTDGLVDHSRNLLQFYT